MNPEEKRAGNSTWRRGKKGSQAEVDYVIEPGSRNVPIEVKSGIKGKMQSLLIFMEEKKVNLVSEPLWRILQRKREYLLFPSMLSDQYSKR